MKFGHFSTFCFFVKRQKNKDSRKDSQKDSRESRPRNSPKTTKQRLTKTQRVSLEAGTVKEGKRRKKQLEPRHRLLLLKLASGAPLPPGGEGLLEGSLAGLHEGDYGGGTSDAAGTEEALVEDYCQL